MEFLLSVILISYLGFKLISYLLKYFIARKMKQFTGGSSWEEFAGRGGRASSNDSSKKREGEVTVTKVTETKKKVSNSVGDYIDFEDVK